LGALECAAGPLEPALGRADRGVDAITGARRRGVDGTATTDDDLADVATSAPADDLLAAASHAAIETTPNAIASRSVAGRQAILGISKTSSQRVGAHCNWDIVQ
jgi:hypothetical protein